MDVNREVYPHAHMLQKEREMGQKVRGIGEAVLGSRGISMGRLDSHGRLAQSGPGVWRHRCMKDAVVLVLLLEVVGVDGQPSRRTGRNAHIQHKPVPDRLGFRYG